MVPLNQRFVKNVGNYSESPLETSLLYYIYIIYFYYIYYIFLLYILYIYIHSWNKIDAIFLSSCIKVLKLTFRALALLPLPWYKRKLCWQRWDSNPRHRNDWCLKPAP